MNSIEKSNAIKAGMKARKERLKVRVQYRASDGKRLVERLNITNRELDEYRANHKTCDICGKGEYVSTGNKTKPNRLSIDHIHGEGKFRGLLCQQCNSKLGWYEKNVDNIKKYLEK